MDLNLKEIQIGSIQVIARNGNRVAIQCLKADVSKLPVKGIESGSTCLILDSSGAEDVKLVFNITNEQETGNWYSVNVGTDPVNITAGNVVYDETKRSVEQLGGV